jgi:hypothetical protein
MTARFVANAKIAACVAPFCAMRYDSAPPRAQLREQMSHFVAQRSINLGGSVIAESRI